MNKNINTLRRNYRDALLGLTYDNASKSLIAEKIAATDAATPAEYLRAIKTIRIPCRRCAHTGRFITGSNNGKPTGPGGPCFRCAGTGSQDYTDGHRNCTHDENYMARVAHY